MIFNWSHCVLGVAVPASSVKMHPYTLYTVTSDFEKLLHDTLALNSLILTPHLVIKVGVVISQKVTSSAITHLVM